MNQERWGPIVTELRVLFAEFLGTLALTFVAAGGLMVDAASHHQLSYAARVIAPGILVMVMIYTIGSTSGAHINPAVTLGFALRGSFPWKRVPGYWISQFIGAIAAVVLLKVLLGNIADLGATLPHMGVPTAFVMEITLTTLLVLVIIGTATGSKLAGPNAGIAVGATVALCGMIGDPVSGASMNPARSLGPLLVGGNLGNAWLYVAAPILGAILAVIFAGVLHGSPSKHEKDAASGEETEARKT